MTELMVAVVSAVAGFLTTRGWPTIQRRVKDHSLLLKDLPPELSSELKTLLAAEVRQLVEHEADRLDRRVDLLLNVRRGGVAVGAAFFVLAGWISGASADEPPTSSTMVATLLLLAIGTAAAVTALVADAQVRRRRDRVAES